jgi:hypothetical protein
MATNNFPDEDSENKDAEAQNDKAEKPKGTKKLPTVPAFQSSDEDELDEIRRTIIDKDSREPESDKAGSPDPFYDLPGDPSLYTDDSNSQPVENNAGSTDQDLDHVDPETPFSEPVDNPEQVSSPFAENDFDQPVDSTPLTPDALDDETGRELPNLQPARTWNQMYEQDLSDDDLTQRINALRSDTAQQASSSIPTTPPFVIDGDFSSDENRDNLTGKIKNGSVQAETLWLLITKSMSESEVTSVAKELGINWSLTPGKTREEKTQFLINYFKSKDYGQTEETTPEAFTGKPKFFTESVEEDWHDSDSRLQALQQSLNIPAAPISIEKIPLLTRLRDDFEQSGSLVRGLTIGLSIFAVLLISVIAYYVITLRKNIPAATPPVVSNELPIPTIVQLPGGWPFDLNIGTVQDGNWKPTSAEWLQGTEICRLVSLPWNKQLNAIFPTFTAGDEILLTMSNKDLLHYTVESTKTINLDELSQLVNRDTPCLVVVLTQKETDKRQVIIALPNFSTKNGAAIVTITPKPDLSPTSAPAQTTATP